MSKKEKEEAPEVWTQKWGVNIREPQEMSDSMTKFTIDATEKAFVDHPDFDKDGSLIAADIRKALEDQYEPCWQVVLGRNFGSHVTYQSNHFINFYRGQVRRRWMHLLYPHDPCVRLVQVNVLIMKTV